MKLESKFRFRTLVAGAVAAAAIAVPSATQAAEVGQVCNLRSDLGAVGVFAEEARINLRYYISSGSGFRIDAFAGNNNYYGSANGVALQGYLWRDYINQSSCHW